MNTSCIARLALGLLAAALLAPTAAAQPRFDVPAERVAGVSGAKRVAPAVAAPAIPRTGLIALDAIDVASLKQEDAQEQSIEKGPVRIGVLRALPAGRLAGANTTAGAWQTLADGRLAWSLDIRAEGAVGLRASLYDMTLPRGVELYAGTPETPTVHGPYTWRDLHSYEFWTPGVPGDTLRISVVAPDAATQRGTTLSLGMLSHRYREVVSPVAAPDKQAGSCNLDVTCFPEWADTASSVARVAFMRGSAESLCTGQLLADLDPCSDVPFFYSANHCIGSQAVADTMEFYWLYQTATCGGAPPALSSVPITIGGADYLGGSVGTAFSPTGNDFALFRLRSQPPAGLTKVGWTDAVPDTGDDIVSIHHPRGDFKRISFGRIAVSTRAAELFHQVVWENGTTEGGSSGSGLYLPATQQLIGALWGGTASCTLPFDPDWYGRLDVTLDLAPGIFDAPPLQVGFVQASFSVGEDEGSTVVDIEATNAPADDLTVAYALVGESATAGEDFVAPSGTVQIDAGTRFASITIELVDNSATETDETLRIELNGASCGMATGALRLTINDDDPDSDGDGLSDADELSGAFGFVTDPLAADSDGDGLSDAQEVNGVLGVVTNPNLRDTDGDGLSDRVELELGLDPLDPSSVTEVPSLRVPWFVPRG